PRAIRRERHDDVSARVPDRASEPSLPVEKRKLEILAYAGTVHQYAAGRDGEKSAPGLGVAADPLDHRDGVTLQFQPSGIERLRHERAFAQEQQLPPGRIG